MATQAAKAKIVNIGGNNVNAASAAFRRGSELLDDTVMNTPTERSRLAGLRDWSVELSGPYDSGNTAQAALISGEAAGTNVTMQYLPNGSAGWSGSGKVENFDLSGDVDGLETFTCTIRADGALSAVTP